jgi:5-methylcytosine-specific restriction enzyme subunit McrC
MTAALITLYEGEVQEVADTGLLKGCVAAELISLRVRRAALALDSAAQRSRWDRASDDDDDDNDDQQETRPVVRWAEPGKLIRVDNLVGSFTLPSGQQVEILPKLAVVDPKAARQSLQRMWSYAMDLNLREDQQTAGVMVEANLPLHEWLLERFVRELNALINKGLRSHYVAEQDNLMTLRGRLDVSRNIRQNAFAAHRFYCIFDILSLNRPENRLLRSAIDVVVRMTSQADTRKKAAVIRDLLHEIPPSQHIHADFAAWRSDRSMLNYREIRQTCEWLLLRQSAAPVRGQQAMFGRLVRMNDVFERYVTRWLAEKIDTGFQVEGQARFSNAGEKILALRGNTVLHSMRPDILIRKTDGQYVAVFDVKWKRPRADKIISREDFYQLYAYATHWLTGRGEEDPKTTIAVIYPSVDDKDPTLAPFRFPQAANVAGYAFHFRLPHFDAPTGWTEGFFSLDSSNCPLKNIGLTEAIITGQ